MGVFHVFKIAQMVSNRATHHKYQTLHDKYINSIGLQAFGLQRQTQAPGRRNRKKTNAKTMANDIQKRSTIIITVVTATTENTLSQIKSKTLYPHRHQRIT